MASPRCETLELVKEHDAGPGSLGLEEQVANIALAGADIFGQQLGSPHRDEVEASVRGHGLGEESLPRARGSVEQEAARCPHPALQEQLRVLGGPQQHLHQTLLRLLQ